MRRGRPPYPDVLTPREQEVLTLIREGLTNDQIATRLGISESGARYHVSEILSKLGVGSRHEAAQWAGEVVQPRRFRLSLPHLSPMLLAGGAVATAAVALVGLAVGVLIMDARDDELADEAVVPTPTEAVAAPCPVPNDSCRLAIEFLPLLLQVDGRGIADRASKQTLHCPTDSSEVPVVGPVKLEGSPFAEVCAGRAPGEAIEVYELNGKGPFLSVDRDEFAGWIAGALPGTRATPRIIAIGCGTATPPSPPDCEHSAVAMYGWREPNGPPIDVAFALIFTRDSAKSGWTIEKVWSVFPGNYPRVPVPPGHSMSFWTPGGTSAVELQPYGNN